MDKILPLFIQEFYSNNYIDEDEIERNFYDFGVDYFKINLKMILLSNSLHHLKTQLFYMNLRENTLLQLVIKWPHKSY